MAQNITVKLWLKNIVKRVRINCYFLAIYYIMDHEMIYRLSIIQKV